MGWEATDTVTPPLKGPGDPSECPADHEPATYPLQKGESMLTEQSYYPTLLSTGEATPEISF